MGRIVGLVIPEPEEVKEAPAPETDTTPENKEVPETPAPEKKSAKK